MDNVSSLEELKKQICEIDGYKFSIKVVANSKNNSLDFQDGYIKLKIKEKPIEGKANKAIIKYLSDVLDIPKTRITILNGEKGSLKLIQVKK